MTALERYFHGSYRAVRPYLFAKLFLAMVALDTWMLMIGHAGRYGVDGFNVAHFRWLDRVQPVPSAALYVGVLVLTGLLALCIALCGLHPVALCALCVLYTFSWSMSMLDSYQHHYFVSSILLCMVFFPRVRGTDFASPPTAATAAQQRESGPQVVSGFGYNLLGVTVGVLYTYTSIAKLDAAWCAGHTIRRISSAETAFAPLVGWCVRMGLPAERFWSLLATSVIPLELCVALGYLLALRQDTSERRWLRWACTLSWLLAMTLHFGADFMGLQIGWFSDYMILLACVFLLPGRIVELLGGLVIWPARFAAAQLVDWHDDDGSAAHSLPTLGLSAAIAVVLGLVGRMLDLPGAQTACLLAAVALLGLTTWAVWRGRAAQLRTLILGTGIAALLMWGAIARSDVRWDFYRYLGGDLKRRGQPEAALDAYRKGERYAPSGQSRRDKIDELERQLGR
jgi:hypothetical protein